MFLHFLSPLALGAVETDLERSHIHLFRRALGVEIETEAAQALLPVDGGANAAHGERARELPRGIGIRLRCSLGGIIDRARFLRRGLVDRFEAERGGRLEERRRWLGEEQRTVEREELVEDEVLLV